LRLLHIADLNHTSNILAFRQSHEFSRRSWSVEIGIRLAASICGCLFPIVADVLFSLFSSLWLVPLLKLATEEIL
jgi:hypothetical protein